MQSKSHPAATNEEAHSSSSRLESAYRSSAFLSPFDNTSAGQLCCVGEFIDPSERSEEDTGYTEEDEENMFYPDESIEVLKQTRKEKKLLLKQHLIHCRDATLQALEESAKKKKEAVARAFWAQFPDWWLDVRQQLKDGRWDGKSPLPWLTDSHIDQLKGVFEKMTGIDCENYESSSNNESDEDEQESHRGKMKRRKTEADQSDQQTTSEKATSSMLKIDQKTADMVMKRLLGEGTTTATDEKAQELNDINRKDEIGGNEDCVHSAHHENEDDEDDSDGDWGSGSESPPLHVRCSVIDTVTNETTK